MRLNPAHETNTNMIIDAHGHVTAPDKLYVYKSD
jgi:hypothetical protein